MDTNSRPNDYVQTQVTRLECIDRPCDKTAAERIAEKWEKILFNREAYSDILARDIQAAIDEAVEAAMREAWKINDRQAIALDNAISTLRRIENLAHQDPHNMTHKEATIGDIAHQAIFLPPAPYAPPRAARWEVMARRQHSVLQAILDGRAHFFSVECKDDNKELLAMKRERTAELWADVHMTVAIFNSEEAQG